MLTCCVSYEGYCDETGNCKTVESQDVLDELDDLLTQDPSDAWAWLKVWL